jgi:hypothetical protein
VVARRQKARQAVRDTLAVNQKSWNDLLVTLQFRGQHSDKLKKLFAMLGQDNDGEFDNLEMTSHQFVAVSLWIAHTFVYQRFTVTPRLMVTSPVRGCGKTTLLDLLEAMCVRPLKSDSITAASIYHAVDRLRTPCASSCRCSQKPS